MATRSRGSEQSVNTVKLFWVELSQSVKDVHSFSASSILFNSSWSCLMVSWINKTLQSKKKTTFYTIYRFQYMSVPLELEVYHIISIYFMVWIEQNTIFFLFLKLNLLSWLLVWGIFRKQCVALPLEEDDVSQQPSTGHHGPNVLWSAIKTENIIFHLLFYLLNVNSYTTRWRGVLCFWHIIHFAEILSQ